MCIRMQPFVYKGNKKEYKAFRASRCIQLSEKIKEKPWMVVT